MPTYAYACTACDHRFEVVQSFTDDALTECPECHGRLRKVFNSVGIVFKGSGFYRTDSRGGSVGLAGDQSSSSGSEKDSGSSGSSPGLRLHGRVRREGVRLGSSSTPPGATSSGLVASRPGRRLRADPPAVHRRWAPSTGPPVGPRPSRRGGTSPACSAQLQPDRPVGPLRRYLA